MSVGWQLTIAAETDVTAEKVVGALEKVFGVHKGERRNHTKGVCATGDFVGSKDALEYSRSALFSGESIAVVARFSLAGGNPNAPDTAKSPRGMALEFRLPNGQLQHMTMLNTPVFGAASPKTFLDLQLASQPDPATGRPDPEKIKAFKANHPDNKAQADFLDKNNPPTSYANSAYFGIHTFKFVNSANKTTFVRWQYRPHDGEQRLSAEQMKTNGPNFLEQELIRRTQRGPVQWDMMVSIGQPGDSQDDPTVAWPDTRQRVRVGVLTIKSAMPQNGAECERINFDPLVMADGIAPTDDPVLRFRSPAYAVSFGKRLGNQ
jgi:catalase